MRDFDSSQLGENDFAFRLVTNRPIALDRFAAFVACLQRFSGNGAFPPYELDIVEFSRGSLFGWLRMRWPDGPPPADQIEHLRREMETMRASLARQDAETLDLVRRQTEAAERQATASESQAKDATATRKWTAVGSGAAVAMLVVTLTTCARDENPNHCSAAIADMMARDDVAAVQFWSRDCAYTVEKRDVPEYQRRLAAAADADTLRATGSVHPASDDMVGGPVAIGPIGVGPLGAGSNPILDAVDNALAAIQSTNIPFPKSAHFPSGADEPPDNAVVRPPDFIPRTVMDSASDHVAGSPTLSGSPPRPIQWRRQKAVRYGTFIDGGDIWTLSVDQGPWNGRTTAVVMPPGAEVIGGMRYRVEGDMFTTDGTTPLIIAATVSPA